MEKFKIGLRAQDFHDGYRDVVTYTPRDVYLRNTLLIGKAATLSMHLRGIGYISNYEYLIMMAAELGINSIELETVLSELEEVKFARVVKEGSSIKRVEITVPELRSGYEELAERWKNLKPSELEIATLETVDKVIHIPLNLEDIQKEIGFSPTDFELVTDLGINGKLLDIVETPNGKMLFSPLTVEENPKPLIELVQNYPSEEVSKALAEVHNFQGIYLGEGSHISNQILTEAARTGVLAPADVIAGADSKTFWFIPAGGLKEEEKIVLDKARAILACVRYGQQFASGTKIIYPKKLLHALADRKRLAYHPFARDQYGILVTRNIGSVHKGKTPRGLTGYEFRLNETPENMKALAIAIDYLETGESPTVKLDLDAQEILVEPASYISPIRSRAKVAREGKASPVTRRKIVEEMSKIVRGVYRG